MNSKYTRMFVFSLRTCKAHKQLTSIFPYDLIRTTSSELHIQKQSFLNNINMYVYIYINITHKKHDHPGFKRYPFVCYIFKTWHFLHSAESTVKSQTHEALGWRKTHPIWTLWISSAGGPTLLLTDDTRTQDRVVLILPVANRLCKKGRGFEGLRGRMVKTLFAWNGRDQV